MNYVRYLTGNYIINVSMLSWLSAQVLKFIVIYLIDRKIDFTRLLGAGGMPSSHTAFVVSMAAAVCKVRGFYSVEFAMALSFALVVMYDASGVRRAAGEQARILNYIMDNWEKQTPDEFQNELKELLGHTPFEVLAGALLGIVMVLIL